jgi:mono/diheme cytochrome c family protein
MKGLLLAVLVCFVVLPAGLGLAKSPQDAAAPKPVLLDGPALFHERGCAQCHQIHGAGGHKGPDLSGVGRRMKQPAIEHQIIAGGDVMPAFGESLAPEEVTALVKYLHSCRDRHVKPYVVPKAEPPPSIPSYE